MGWLSKKWKQIKGWFTPSEPKPQGVNIEKKGTNQGVQIIYGFVKKSPCIKVLKVTTDKSGGAVNEYLHFICVFAVGEIEEIGQLYFNDIPQYQIDSERYFIKKFLGSENQTYCTELAAEFSRWKTTAKLKNVAYAYVRLTQNKKVDWWRGEPSIAADLKGLKVLDPRDGLVKYSENPALCAYDYLTNADYGKGLSVGKVNTASFIAAANFNEVSRTYTRTIYKTEYIDGFVGVWERNAVGTVNETVIESLMSCNVSLDPEKTLKKNVEILLGGMRAMLPETDGQYRLAIEKDDAPVFAFTSDNLVGAIQCQGGSQSDRYNQVIIRFRNKLTGEDDEAVFPDDDALHQQWRIEDGGTVGLRDKLLLGEFDFDTINNRAEALQMGHVIAHRSRNLLGALFAGLPETIVVEAGDIVTLPSKIFGWIAKPFRVESVDINLKTGKVNFQAVEHQNTIYPWAISDVIEEYADTSFALPQSIEAPTGLAFAAIINDNLKQGKLSWADANNALVSFYVIETYNNIQQLISTQTSTDNFIDLFGLASGNYTFKVYAANALHQSQSTDINVNITETSIGWDTVEGFDFDDSRINNAIAIQSAQDYADGQFVDSVTHGTALSDLQSQIDGNITTWFLNGVPTLANAPANTWTTTTLKNQHLSDLYYDDATGFAYRFKLVSTVYSWQKLDDSDITKALSDASKAQDTADSKRRVFVVQPIVPYDVGDLWDIGTGFKRCINAKLITGAYSSNDWQSAADITDYNDNRVSNSQVSTSSLSAVPLNTTLFPRYKSLSAIHGTGAITTTQFITALTNAGCFSGNHNVFKASWDYAGHGYISDTGVGIIDLAGATIEIIGTSGTYMIRITSAPSASGHSGIAHTTWEYRNHGSSYNPGWRMVLNSGNFQNSITQAYINSLGVAAATASQWQTPRTLTTTLTGDVTGSASMSVDGSGNKTTTINAVVQDDSHNHVIGNVDNLQTALDFKIGFGDLTYDSATTYAVAFETIQQMNDLLKSGSIDTSAYSLVTDSHLTGFINSIIGQFNVVVAASANIGVLDSRLIDVDELFARDINATNTITGAKIQTSSDSTKDRIILDNDTLTHYAADDTTPTLVIGLNSAPNVSVVDIGRSGAGNYTGRTLSAYCDYDSINLSPNTFLNYGTADTVSISNYHNAADNHGRALNLYSIKNEGLHISTDSAVAPMSVTSSVKVDNLNVSLLGGIASSGYRKKPTRTTLLSVPVNTGTIFITAWETYDELEVVIADDNGSRLGTTYWVVDTLKWCLDNSANGEVVFAHSGWGKEWVVGGYSTNYLTLSIGNEDSKIMRVVGINY